jgi:hypothetical protein
MGQGRLTTITNFENINLEADIQEGVAGGVCYSDSAGVNLQVCFTLHLCWNSICNVGMHVDINLSSSPFFFLVKFSCTAFSRMSFFFPEG